MFNIIKDFRLYQISQAYKKETELYTYQVNAYRSEGMKTKWQEPLDIAPPQDTREDYAETIYEIIAQANQKGWTDKLRRLFPPQTEIFYSFTRDKKDVSDIRKIIWIENDTFLAMVDEPYYSSEFNQYGKIRKCYLYEGKNFKVLPEVINIGICPQKKVLAFLKEDGIHLTDRKSHKQINFIPWVKSNIYFYEGTAAALDVDTSIIGGDICIPFSNGKRVLLGNEDYGFFLLDKDNAKIIFPDKKYYEECCQQEDSLATVTNVLECGGFDMLHCALSNNNQYIALGSQCSSHLIYEADGKPIGNAEPIYSDPHYCLFSKDDSQVVYNSCHFYNGTTLAIKFSDIANNTSLEPPFITLDMEARVYAAVATSYGYIIGDASGYIRARSFNGDYLWDDYLGFNILTMDLTEDEECLYVGTYKGIIYKIKLNAGYKDPYKIGNSSNQEICRWLFWEEDKIFQW